jgi:hypothetical protein
MKISDSVNHILLPGCEGRTRYRLGEARHEEGYKRVAVANERHCWESTLFGFADSWRGSPTRIFTNGDLRNLVTCRIGLLHSANSMGSKRGDKEGKKEITPQDMDSGTRKSLEAKQT